MAKSKVYLTANGGKTKEGADDAAFIVNGDDADNFAKRLKGASVPSEPTVPDAPAPAARNTNGK